MVGLAGQPSATSLARPAAPAAQAAPGHSRPGRAELGQAASGWPGRASQAGQARHARPAKLGRAIWMAGLTSFYSKQDFLTSAVGGPPSFGTHTGAAVFLQVCRLAPSTGGPILPLFHTAEGGPLLGLLTAAVSRLVQTSLQRASGTRSQTTGISTLTLQPCPKVATYSATAIRCGTARKQ